MGSLLRFITFATTKSLYVSYVQILLLAFAVTFSIRSNIIWSFVPTKQEKQNVKEEQGMTRYEQYERTSKALTQPTASQTEVIAR
jgi:hypothetical protein